MKISEIRDILKAEMLVGHDQLDKSVVGGGGADLMADVLSAVAEKAVDNAGAGQRPASNAVTELTYPLQRARQFAYQLSLIHI